MANTAANLAAERWVVDHGLPGVIIGHRFAPRKMPLTWGGQFAFDAVSDDGSIVAVISTSSAKTATGKNATAKFQKLKTDALYLLHLAAPARMLMVFTEVDMRDYFDKATRTGRFPPSIERLFLALPSDLQAGVLATRAIASRETSPR